ncbi:putative polyketide synthase [Pseudomassariella vexata]|uniref:Putative polyketide synthase n=1 Tax=Pseudomassariella vexata TaxID=1141098 RepID=A0A1Y2EK99_9PEZI|nr:putative polyketide synthase [Pseudomassariella vexata]ORY71958.1 putative polyketide synthase [Pseudomassariella vexata]
MVHQPHEPIAIVGSACRFAGDVNSPSKLWELLQEPHDLRQEISGSNRISAEGFYHPDNMYHGHTNVRHAYLSNADVDAFDAGFFGIKPSEAKAMDPQQRFLIEVVYEGLESAGISTAQLKGSDTGVYVGVMFDDYSSMLLRDFQTIPTYYATGTSRSMLANRISYFFDWHGPSISIDTACSSSLVAVHMAIQALRAGETRVAFACGSNLILGPEGFIVESKLKMLSPDGLGRMWDQGADGYARGDGVAAVVLKTLSAALEDGDHIECIIRETGLNQNGRSATAGGITLPSASAQETLIRDTYTKAGLDLRLKSDGPQYFEAHGTGTQAGDPAEAEAVYNAFCRDDTDIVGRHPLYVGSGKTVHGHTEGAAGVAALLKVSLALQHGSIPPNLLFEQLSDRVAPFYKNMEIPTTARSWPDVFGAPRRASVNSFGFGGTNAHAIVERYTPDPDPNSANLGLEIRSSPHEPEHDSLLFVFSAFCENSLRARLSAYADFFACAGPGIDPRELAWTLRQRRSVFPYRAAFVASSLDDLKAKTVASLQEEKSTIGVKAIPQAKIMGVFTGQGAQYARLGAELIEKSKSARIIIQELESHLARLPDGDAPTWSLQAEILANANVSRVHEAAISQAVCTAIQILLVDLLHLAGVHFTTVVGHSSGEIAAAYAAGYLTARDAMYVAYYRGLHTRLACSPNEGDIKGAMMAVGSSMEDMAELCADRVFSGRVAVAAINSSSSVTVSGDEDAIAELEIILDDEGKFHRRIKVEKAYHSKHMLPCVDPCTKSLHRSGVAPQKPGKTSSCTWVSSVYDSLIDEEMAATLGDIPYWVDGVKKPVLFMQAIRRAMAVDPCHLVLEVGAHPALKGPASQTIQEIMGKAIPYHGMLARGTCAVEATSRAMGFLWSYMDHNGTRLNLDSYENTVIGDKCRRFIPVKGLPTYRWNHSTKFRHESRKNRKMVRRQERVHPLLGDVTTDSAPHHMSWRNLLRVSEMEWLSGHKVQGQTVFPAAGYITTALEASRCLAKAVGQKVRLIELHDFIIHQAMVFDDQDAGIEVLISMADIAREPQQPHRVRAKFTYSTAQQSFSQEDLTLAASSYIEIIIGADEPSLLPVRQPELPHMIDVEPERFYAALADLGYEFSGPFRSLFTLKRKYGKSACLVRIRRPREVWVGSSDNEGKRRGQSLLIHPSELDAALQCVLLAHSYPYDQQLRTIHLPTTIQKIRVNPALCFGATNGDMDGSQDEFVPVDAAIVPPEAGQRGIVGYMNLYSNASSNSAIQVQNATFMPLGGATADEDRRVFSKVHWIASEPNGLEAARNISLTNNHRDTIKVLERISTFYLRKFDQQVPPDHPKRSEFPTNWYLNYARHITSMVLSNRHKWAQKEWLDDSLDDIFKASKPFSHLPDVQIMHLVGEQMPRVFSGETTMLEQFRHNSNDILDRYYEDGFGLNESSQWISQSVKQIVDRYPHMNILEIGKSSPCAGTGGATKAIFREIGQSYLSYTYTDISAAFFENASSIFSQHRDRMIFKTLDVERDPLDQGYMEGTYDLVVAFFVIHATSDLERALRHMRKLLKPGGFLAVGEGQEGQNGVASSGFIFGTLPGWWLGTETGRTLSPHVSPEEWDQLLRKTGFSGIDSQPSKEFQDVLNMFHFVSQAVNDQVMFFREPLSPSSWNMSPIRQLVIVGGQTARSSRLVEGLQDVLGGSGLVKELHSFQSLLDVDYEIIDASSTVVSLTEVDSPVFKDISPAIFGALKTMFESGKLLFWITSGRRDDEPFLDMTVGFGRTAANESPDLHIQQLDIEDLQNTSPRTIAEMVIRFHAAVTKQQDDLLWTVEPEIVIDSKQCQLISRLQHIPELNDRHNSAWRTVVREVDSPETPVSVKLNSSGGCTINQLWRCEGSALVYHSKLQGFIELQTTHTVLPALLTPLGHKFLVLGVQSDTGTPYWALIPSLASVLRVPAESAVACARISDLSSGELLALVAAHLVAMTVLSPLYSSQTLVAHNATSIVAQALAEQAASKNVDVIYTTDSTDEEETPDFWIKLPRYVTQAEIEDTLLSSAMPSSFVGFSDNELQKSENEATLISSLSKHCQNFLTADLIYGSDGRETDPSTAAVLGDILRKSLEFVRQSGCLQEKRHLLATISSVSLDRLACAERRAEPLSIIDWTASASLPIHITRLDSNPMFKSAESTYWVVGISGALGISLIDWMISKGARCIALTSRNPNVAPEWIVSHKRQGTKVVVISGDVTDEASLQAVHRQICETLPPIVGVIQGAMVLRDTAIRNMSFGQLTDVLKPKVDGSIHLDNIFSNTDLDFFLMISSINCVVGNSGQANYAAANAFMCSLAAHRRKRGLRAATVNAGAIIGAGYMERESRRALDQIVQRQHMMRLSEDDWCQAICEAIDASRLDSPHGPELTTGISDVPFYTSNAPNWHSNPRFSSFLVHQKVATGDGDKGKASESIQQLLQSCQSQKDLEKVIKQAFATQLRNMLQVTMSDEDLMSARGSDIGLDSLVSVDIRSWFLKKLQCSIPVLQIMSNDTMATLVQYAVKSVPAELVPQISQVETNNNNKNETLIANEPQTSVAVEADSSEKSRSSDRETPIFGASSSSSLTTPSELKGMIDWEAESWPTADIADLLDHESQLLPAARAVTPPRVIVITGVSGLLGHHLLAHLLAHTSAEKIICLAVRQLTSRLQNKELSPHPCVVYYEGNLSSPLLGLSPEKADSIFAEADVVIHNGADTSHLKYYADVRASNVGSTMTLARLCLPRRIPIHYVSSAGLGVLYNHTRQGVFPAVSVTGPESALPAHDGSFGYMSSKWTSERFLERVHQRYGLRICIHRPSTIIREGDDASTPRAQFDWVNALLHYVRQIEAVPRVVYNRGALDLVHVDSVCADVIRHVFDDSDGSKNRITYVHEVGDVVINMDCLQDIGLERGKGSKPFDVLPMDKWIAKAIAAGLHPAVATLIEDMDSLQGLEYPRPVKGAIVS